ncbi:hypothetical protein DFQ01_101457 [Paenibacillus cellulosilyticus]|uniref:Uncharacterized protein n=1 Tax=Paenibacillus cellulosilyticus TaxID=375489 RepID=A0A2V2Z9E2_9BACL|nr:hypothetical protein [Paenibacillus cellulosilyticus]PWW08731.1 hypothetical protein DFQ01_101457 [Paenibacillus cellulosilyticus]QKS48294.1 hypothetical protein HUB94_28905 [Paenibacillus cellulosilyticus]
MTDRRYVKAIISWRRDPSQLPVNEWLRDFIIHMGEIKDRSLQGDTWTVLVRVTGHINETWDTHADVAYLVDEAPWIMLEAGYSFKLWAGKDNADVTII